MVFITWFDVVAPGRFLAWACPVFQAIPRCQVLPQWVTLDRRSKMAEAHRLQFVEYDRMCLYPLRPSACFYHLGRRGVSGMVGAVEILWAQMSVMLAIQWGACSFSRLELQRSRHLWRPLSALSVPRFRDSEWRAEKSVVDEWASLLLLSLIISYVYDSKHYSAVGLLGLHVLTTVSDSLLRTDCDVF